MSDAYPELAYLHDCEVLSVNHVLTNPDSRDLILTLQRDAEMGYVTWEGKALRVTASGVFLFRCESWGHTWGKETLDRWNNGVSELTETELARQEALGFRVPELRFTVSFRTGSFFELVCETVNVEVVAPDQKLLEGETIVPD